MEKNRSSNSSNHHQPSSVKVRAASGDGGNSKCCDSFDREEGRETKLARKDVSAKDEDQTMQTTKRKDRQIKE